MTLTYADGTELLSADAKWLERLRLKLERAENVWRDGMQGIDSRKAWHIDYMAYHTARVKLEQAECIPCPRCKGDGETFAKECAHVGLCPCGDYFPCEDCGGSGKWWCSNCGDHGATVTDSTGDPVCQGCADELKAREI